MNALLHTPLFKFVLAFALGILLSDSFGPLVLWLSLPAFPLLLLCFRKDRKRLSWQYESLMAGLILLAGIGMGSLRQIAGAYEPPIADLSSLNCERVQLAGVIDGPVKESAYGKRAWVQVFAVAVGDSSWQIRRDKVQAYFPKEMDSSLHRFDSLVLRVDLRDLSSRYPDYLAYLQRNGISLAAYVKEVEVMGRQGGIAPLALAWQERLADRVGGLMQDSLSRGIALAMYLGDKKQLTPEVREAFATAGLSHILAISGLHVGIIFLVLNFLFSPLHLLRNGLKLKQAAVLLVLIAYVLMTGASPAVVRAGLMFGTVLLFRLLHQRYHMLNLLAISGLGQLLYEPGLLFEIGFQLSYSAVMGIVCLLPVLENFCNSPFPLLNRCYSAIGVTLTATLATTPLVLIHFGKFPTYFLLANILSSFLSFLSVLSGFLLVLFQSVPYVNTCLAWVNEHLLGLLIELAQWVASLPHALIQEASWQEQGLWILGIELALTAGFMLLPKLRLPQRSSRPSFGNQVVPAN